MILFSEQYNLISKIWQSFKNNKKSDKVRISKEDLDYAKIHYNPSKFENYTKENFISVLLYIIYEKDPVSKTDFLKYINESNKKDLLNSLKFKNTIINYSQTFENDFKFIRIVNLNEYKNIHEMYKEGKISLLSFYSYYKEYPNELKGRIAKKDFKKISLLLEFFNIKEEIKWPLQ
jgi:Mg2+/Co2+ transporter CorC